jgi:hypothetical protein
VVFEQARDVILDLLRRGNREPSGDFKNVVSVSAFLLGIDVEQQSARMRGALERCFPGAVLEVTNDALAELTACTLDRAGIAVWSESSNYLSSLRKIPMRRPMENTNMDSNGPWGHTP